MIFCAWGGASACCRSFTAPATTPSASAPTCWNALTIAWPCRCRRRFRKRSSRPSSICRPSPPCFSATPTRRPPASRMCPSIRVRASSPRCVWRSANTFRAPSSTGRLRISRRRPASFPIRMLSSASAPRASPPPSCRPSRRRIRANTPSASPGWPGACASWNAAIVPSSSSARCSIGRGFAMPTCAGCPSRNRRSSSRPCRPSPSIRAR